MATMTTFNNTLRRLEDHQLRKQFIGHEFFRYVEETVLTKEKAAVFVGQWWHPLHYFTTFLARCVEILPDIESKSAISRILFQESGGGNAKQAHEVIYIDTMERAGFERWQITESTAFEQTTHLLAGYKQSSTDPLSSLGAIFATEVTDLAMVSAIGRAVSGATGLTHLDWVDIHIAQEPDHVEKASHVLLDSFNKAEESRIVESAEEMWRRWSGFFDRLLLEVTVPVNQGTRAVAP